MVPVASLLAEKTETVEMAGPQPVTRGRHRRCPATATPERELTRAGLTATGTIVDVIDTGSLIEDVPLIWVTLLVECADRPPYRVQADALLPRHAQTQARVGERVALLVDPTQCERVLVRWGRPLT
jgi:hypothetical protein